MEVLKALIGDFLVVIFAALLLGWIARKIGKSLVELDKERTAGLHAFTADWWKHSTNWFLGFEDSFSKLQNNMERWKEKSSFFWDERGQWTSNKKSPPTTSGPYLVAVLNENLMKYRYFDQIKNKWYEREEKENTRLVEDNEEFMYCKVFAFK